MEEMVNESRENLCGSRKSLHEKNWGWSKKMQQNFGDPPGIESRDSNPPVVPVLSSGLELTMLVISIYGAWAISRYCSKRFIFMILIISSLYKESTVTSSHFTDEENESCRGRVTCPRSHSKWQSRPPPRPCWPWSPCSPIHSFIHSFNHTGLLLQLAKHYSRPRGYNKGKRKAKIPAFSLHSYSER